MTAEEYFGDWMRVIDRPELIRISTWIGKQNPAILCPPRPDIFKAFTLCSLRDCKVVFLGQDPYPQKGVATGVLFGNSKDTPEDKLSPSLDIIKEASVNYEIPHQELVFDNTLESWAKQGILMINSALTCRMNEIGSHVLNWRQFTARLLSNMSSNSSGIVYVLFGRQAQSFRQYIDDRYNDVIETEHPSYFARTQTKMPYSVFRDINRILKARYGMEIMWYKDYDNTNTNKNYYGKEENHGDDFFWPCSL